MTMSRSPLPSQVSGFVTQASVTAKRTAVQVSIADPVAPITPPIHLCTSIHERKGARGLQ